jgi:hypothetical protein
LDITNTGVTTNDWAALYEGFQETEVPPDCTIRRDSRNAEPVLMERTPEGFFFDRPGLAGMHKSWNAHSSIVIEASQPMGGLAWLYVRLLLDARAPPRQEGRCKSHLLA